MGQISDLGIPGNTVLVLDRGWGSDMNIKGVPFVLGAFRLKTLKPETITQRVHVVSTYLGHRGFPHNYFRAHVYAIELHGH